MDKVYMSCAICTNKATSGEILQVAFHRFPSDVTSRDLWMRICGFLKGMNNVQSLFICSSHFTINDYIDLKTQEGGRTLQLKVGAYPSILVPNPIHITDLEDVAEPSMGHNFSSNDEDIKLNSVKSPVDFQMLPEFVKCENFEVVEEVMDVKPILLHEETVEESLVKTTERKCSTPKSKFGVPRYIGDIIISDIKTPRETMICINLAKETFRKKNAKIKLLRQQNKQFKARIETLKSLVTQLRNKKSQPCDKNMPHVFVENMSFKSDNG